MIKSDELYQKLTRPNLTEAELTELFACYWETAVTLNPEGHRRILSQFETISHSELSKNHLALSRSLFYIFFPTEGSAFEAASLALSLFRKSGNSAGMGAGQCILALYYKNSGQLDKAEKNVIEAIKNIGNDNTYSNFMGLACYQSGEIYHLLKEYETAIYYFNKGLELKNIPSGLQARFLNGMGSLYLDNKNPELALKYFNDSLNSSGSAANLLIKSKNFSDIGKYYETINDYQKAFEYYTKSLEIRKENKYAIPLITCYTDLANLFLKQNKSTDALQYATQALELAENLNIQLKLHTVHHTLASIYEALNQPGKALYHFKKYSEYNEEVYHQENNKVIKQLNLQHEIETIQREKEIFTLRNVELKQANEELELNIKLVEKERERSESLLLNILPPSVAEELKNNGKYSARKFENATVLFSDFSRFTEVAEKMSAAELVDELHECFSAFDTITSRFGIEKIKTIGDAYMAVGGLNDRDGIQNTILAALEMQDFIATRINDNESKGKPFFTMRIGIHSGPIVAGIVGTKKFQYDIWGDTVNTASRMESHGESEKINISDTTYQQIKHLDLFEFENRGSLHVKGKGEMQMWFVHRKNHKPIFNNTVKT